MAAGLMQAVRTAAQKSLSAHLSLWMTTYVRSLAGLPFILVYLLIVTSFEGRFLPHFSAAFVLNCVGTAVSQVIATYMLIQLFRMSNFAVGTMLTKTDTMQAAIVGSVLFSETITPVGWAAITLTMLGVLLMSVKPGTRTQGFAASATLLGLGSAFLFCLSYLFLREASLVLETGSAVWRSAWSLVTTIGLQVLGLGLWLLWREPTEFRALARHPKPVLFVGVTSALGSIGWFTAMALQNASYVKAVGQTEVIFTILISTLYFGEKITRRESLGILLVLISVLMFLL